MTDSEAQPPPQRIPAIEWLVAAVGAVCVVGALALLLHRWATTDGSPPDIVLEVGAISHGSGGWRVEVLATNLGGRTAEDVQITGSLEVVGAPTEESQAAIGYLPVRSTREVVLVFESDPNAGGLEVSVRGFSLP